jgi:hypothetical protein
MAVVGVAHIGKMGFSLAHALVRSGHQVLSASYGRSEETRTRAEKVGTREVEKLSTLFDESDFVFSIATAMTHGESAVWNEEAQEMLTVDGEYPKAIDFPMIRAAVEAEFQGIYVDCNWFHTGHWELLRKISKELPSYVECAIYGWPLGDKRDLSGRIMWLSGDNSTPVGNLFDDGCGMNLQPLPLGASALEHKEYVTHGGGTVERQEIDD